MKQLWHVVSAVKNLLIITVGAVLGLKIISQQYDLNSLAYFIIGLCGFTLLSWLEEDIKKNGS